MPLLDITGLKKSFGGVQALAGLRLSVEPETITGLIGPNGAGKSSLFNVVSGLTRPDAGKVMFDGADITGEPDHAEYRQQRTQGSTE